MLEVNINENWMSQAKTEDKDLIFYFQNQLKIDISLNMESTNDNIFYIKFSGDSREYSKYYIFFRILDLFRAVYKNNLE